MSYCVNCGVELKNSEVSCPLCNTVAFNPKKPDFKAEKVYSADLELVFNRGKSLAFLSLLLLLIPISVCFVADLLTDNYIYWSGYVIPSLLCFWVYFMFPLVLKKPKPFLCMVVNTFATALALFIMALFTKSLAWFYYLALPITLSTGLNIYCNIKLFTFKKFGKLQKISTFLLLLGFYIVTINVFINLFLFEKKPITWSIYVLIPLAIMALIGYYIEANTALKEKIERRIFI